MRQIPLTKGAVALVDDADYDWLSLYDWHLATRRRYAARRLHVYEDPKKPILYMHQAILKTPVGMCSDHIDRNTLNNQRSNLRIITWQQNIVWRTYKKRYHGITLDKRNGIWMARIQVDGKTMYLGGYHNKLVAAKAYNDAALRYFGEFAVLNDVEGML